MESPRPGQLVSVWIHVREPARAAGFYASVLGWAAVPTGSFLAPGGVRVAFRRGEPSTAGPALYAAVGDLDAALLRARGAGGTLLVRPAVGPEGQRLAQVVDTEGNRIGLVELLGAARPEGSALVAHDAKQVMP